MRHPLIGLSLLLAGAVLPVNFLQGQRCGGTERWAVKDGTDSRSSAVQLQPHIPVTLHDLINLPMPTLPNDNTTRLSEETHVYELTGKLLKFRHETDDDYHLVVSDSTLIFTDDQAGTPPGHSVIVEIPDPNCFAGQHGNPQVASRFVDAIRSARSELETQFPTVDETGAWNDAGGITVKVVGVGFFDRPHGQTGRASNNIELHPVLDIVFNPGPPPVAGVTGGGPASTALPTTTVTNPSVGSTVSGSVNISASGSTNATKLELYIDGAVVACNVNATSIAYPWDTTKGANGRHEITSRVYDAVGNVIVSTAVTAVVAN